MSVSESTMSGGQPSTTQPIAGPWLSPKDVTVKSFPRVLPDMEVQFNSLGLCQRLEQRMAPRDTKTRDVGTHRAQSALRTRSRKIHVDPRPVFGEALEKTRGENVIGAAFERALLDIGHGAFERLIVVV